MRLAIVAAGAAALVGCASKYTFEPAQTGGGQTWNFGEDNGATDNLTADATGPSDSTGDGGGKAADSDATSSHPPGTDGTPRAGSDDVTDPSEADVDDGEGVGNGSTGCGVAACTTDGDCPDSFVATAACTEVACFDGCCEIVLSADGVVCDDADACTTDEVCAYGQCAGAPQPCDDGLACTIDVCQPADGSCVGNVLPGACLIDGACQVSGTAHPNETCLWCDPAADPLGWVNKPGCCAQAADCPAPGICDEPVCDVETGHCSVTAKLGCCGADSDCGDGNPCTLDACDVQTGNCDFQAKVCTAQLPCENASCSLVSGQCELTVQAGFCRIDGQCLANGAEKPGQPCLVCDAVQQQQGWVAAVGKPCDDGDGCTDADACNAAAACVGASQGGCCFKDADCPQSSSACKLSYCNVAAGVCTVSLKGGCCDEGACCDLNTNLPKAAKTVCAEAAVATEYQCAGNAVQVRLAHPGCDGQSATGCSSSSLFVWWEPWATVETCAPKTQCTPAGNGKPTCKPTGPVGSCQGACGGKSKDGSCYCDNICTGAGDCCDDFLGLCGCGAGECCDVAKMYPKAAGLPCGPSGLAVEYTCNGTAIQKRVGQGTCDGKNSCSSAQSALLWSGWSTVQTCPSGTACKVTGGGEGATCEATDFGSCSGKCGGKSNGTCWCDKACESIGDCCGDYPKFCGCGSNAGSTCKGSCGGLGNAGCWCDDLCAGLGDCCSDKAVCCGL